MPKINVTDLIGKPFVRGGTGTGFDCYTLCREVSKRAGINLPDEKEFVESMAERSQLFSEGKTFCKHLKKPKPFCIVAFSMVRPFVTHLGVVLEDCRHFIHILGRKSGTVCIERLDYPLWARRREGFYEYIG